MKKRYRLRKNERFQEIRKKGRSYSSDALILNVLPNDLPYSRFGFSVSSRLGGAVERNRIKRRLREIMRLRMAQLRNGWDLVLIARTPSAKASYQELDAICARLLGRARLFVGGHEVQTTVDDQKPSAKPTLPEMLERSALDSI